MWLPYNHGHAPAPRSPQLYLLQPMQNNRELALRFNPKCSSLLGNGECP